MAGFFDLFRDLAVASRAVAAYPAGHPSALTGLTRAHATLAEVLRQTGPLELGAARDAILDGEERYTSPAAAQLARLLRRRRAAAIFFEPGVTVEELEALLRALAVDARTAGEAGALSTELAAAGLVRIRVSDLDFSSLALVEGEGEGAPVSQETGAYPERVIRRLLVSGALPAHAYDAWVGSGRSDADLLRVILETAGAGQELGPWGPGAFAAAVVASEEERGRLAEGRERGAGGQAPGAGGQVAAVLRASLHGAQLETLRRAFAVKDVDDFRQEMDPATILDGLVDLPEEGAPPPLPPAADALRAELADPGMEREPAAVLLEVAERPDAPADAVAALLARFAVALRRMLASGRLQSAAALVEQVKRGAAAPGPAAPLFRDCATGLSGAETIDALVAPLAGLPEDAVVHALAFVQRLDPDAIGHLLDVLARTENRRTRYRLLDLLVRLGPAVARDAEMRLGDERWYVVRNMLLLLRRVGDVRSVPAVRACVDHRDLRVRMEAIHNLFAFDPIAPGKLLRRALNDPDPRQAEAAMDLVGKYGIAEAVQPIVEYLSAWDPLGRKRPIRLKAIRALAAIGDPAALHGLKRFRGRTWPFVPSVEERRELYRTLPAYPEEACKTWVAEGLRSRDPEIRRLSAGVGRGPGSAP
jgi:hypothetical protein